MLKSTLLTILLAFASLAASAGGFSVSGGARSVISLEPERNSGLEALFVVDASAGSPLVAVYTPDSPGATVSWSRFSNLGGGFAEPVDGADGYTLAGLQPDMGYIVTEGGRQHCFWVVDYGSRPFSIDGVGLGQSDCSTASLIPSGEGARMVYYSVNGRAIEIDREITVTYTTLEYDEEAATYRTAQASSSFTYLRDELHVAAPLADTRFVVGGDRFLRHWGDEAEAQSPLLTATAVQAAATAVQNSREGADNEITSDSGDGLGGSAPCEVSFSAAVTDAAIFTEWQFARDPEFEDITLRFADPVFDYTFIESGTTYVRFYAANADGSCDYTGDTFTVTIGESALKCPNAFSPGASEGVNDEWRVSYKSLISFECHIFSRSGRQVAHLTDPAQGWDGRIGGKLAPSGTYYYIIRAEGSDGKKYNLSGDINIIGYR